MTSGGLTSSALDRVLPAAQQLPGTGKLFGEEKLHIKGLYPDLEHVYDYRPGGHHPVHLGDVYPESGRYRVIHKLGKGGYGNVWLCLDTHAETTTRYVALKILMACVSNETCPDLNINKMIPSKSQSTAEKTGANRICLSLDTFKIQGPNGDHQCFIYPLLGPRASFGFFGPSNDADSDLRGICLQVTQGLQYLHNHGLCHGDLTASNVLNHVSGLDGLNEQDVIKVLRTPTCVPVVNSSGVSHGRKDAPQYLVDAVQWGNVDIRYISRDVSIIDFGESFQITSPPEKLGIPKRYRSPELILENKIGIGCDIWALGCTLFEIRTGRKLFDSYDDDDDEYLMSMVEIYGKFPEPWWSTTWEGRKEWYRDEADAMGRVVSLHPEVEDPTSTSTVHPSVAEGARSMKDKLAPGVWYMDGPANPTRGIGDSHREIPETEQELFADLLAKLLKFEPGRRISAGEAAKHEWFRPIQKSSEQRKGYFSFLWTCCVPRKRVLRS